MNWITHLSLLSGVFVYAVTVAASAAMACAVIGARARWGRDAAALGVLSLALVVVVGQAVGIEHRVGSTFPRSFFVWAALPVFAVSWALLSWRSWRWARRMAAVAAVALSAIFGASLVNSHYAYWPTVGDALGRPVTDQVPLQQLAVGAAPLGTGRSGSVHGDVISVDIPGSTSGFRARPAMVWLPPVYVANPRVHLPVVIVLSGVPGDPTNMIRAGHAAHAADVYAAAHHGLAPILVFPDHNGGFLGDSECVDGPRGHVETYLMSDVPRFLQARFGATMPDAHWGILGFSEGGTCAVTLALRHPGDFGGFVDIAGDLRPNAASGPHERALTIARLYGGDVHQWFSHDPLTLLRSPMPARPAAIFAAGTDDRDRVASIRTLATATQRAGLPTTSFLVPGGHNFMLVQHVLPEVFPVLADRLLGGLPVEEGSTGAV